MLKIHSRQNISHDLYLMKLFKNFSTLCLYYNAASSGWDTDPVTGVQYQRNTQSVLTWHQARKSCQQQGADLLSIVELHEQSYISGTKSALYESPILHNIISLNTDCIIMYGFTQGWQILWEHLCGLDWTAWILRVDGSGAMETHSDI